MRLGIELMVLDDGDRGCQHAISKPMLEQRFVFVIATLPGPVQTLQQAS